MAKPSVGQVIADAALVELITAQTPVATAAAHGEMPRISVANPARWRNAVL
ncbi:MAG: hypothetical protein R3C26_23720 [Calditrichia bacterium]